MLLKIFCSSYTYWRLLKLEAFIYNTCLNILFVTHFLQKMKCILYNSI